MTTLLHVPEMGVRLFGFQDHVDHVESGPWIFYGESIRAVEVCSVHDLDYATLPGSGESCCKIKLMFTDPMCSMSGKTFKLTIPELVNYPDFLVEKTWYDASLERNWSVGDKCCVWWRDEGEGGTGKWWHGQVESISDKSDDFPGSPWERIIVKYEDIDGAGAEISRHSPWELHGNDIEWEQPEIDSDIRKMMLSSLSKLEQSARGNQDKFGIMKLKQVSERLDFINRFPVPLTLETIELRIKNMYYRISEAMNHDIRVMLSNVKTYFAKHAEMSGKMTRLSDWFERTLSKL